MVIYYLLCVVIIQSCNITFQQQGTGPYGSQPYQSGPASYPGVDKNSGDSPRGANTRHKSKEGKGGAYAGPLGEKSKLAPVHQGKG